MIVSTPENVTNRETIQILGIARGITVSARNIGRNIFTGLKSIVGGEIEE